MKKNLINQTLTTFQLMKYEVKIKNFQRHVLFPKITPLRPNIKDVKKPKKKIERREERVEGKREFWKGKRERSE